VPTKLSSFSFDLNVDPDRESHGTERDLQGRVILVVMGDFTGRASRGVIEPLPPRKLLNVDLDNFARLFAQLGAKLKLTGAEIPDGVVELGFASTDDFHPDQLLTRVPLLAKLVEARRLLLNPLLRNEARRHCKRVSARSMRLRNRSPAPWNPNRNPPMKRWPDCLAVLCR
jgi:type VI secretion system ImpB/VipA family protein